MINIRCLYLACLAVLAATVFGCEMVVKRDPIPAADVRFLASMHHCIITTEPVRSTASAFARGHRLHYDYSGRADCVVVYHEPVSQLTTDAQYVGRITWSGTIPEIPVPESLYNELGLPVPVNLPERIRSKIKADAAQKGGNVVILDFDGVSYRWVMEGGRLQPEFLFFNKAYYVTNGLGQTGFSP